MQTLHKRFAKSIPLEAETQKVQKTPLQNTATSLDSNILSKCTSLLGLKSFTDKTSKQITETEKIKLTSHTPSLTLTGMSYFRVII